MSWNGINARLFNLAWGLHELCTVWRCFTSPAALNAHNHLYADSCPPLSSVAPKYPVDSEVHSRGVCVCVCVHVHMHVFSECSQLTLTTVHCSEIWMCLQPAAYILPSHAVGSVMESMHTVLSVCFMSYLPSWIRQGLSEGCLLTPTVDELCEVIRNPHRDNKNYRKKTWKLKSRTSFEIRINLLLVV